MSDHKVTIEVELSDGTVIRKQAGLNSGNPIFHAEAVNRAALEALADVEKAIGAVYGDIRQRTSV